MSMNLSLGLGLGSTAIGGASDPIMAIFVDGTDGFYFDFSKTDRLFQTQAGLTPADDAGENIALALESSKWAGRTYAEIVAAATELFPDGGMSDASTGWTYSNATGSIVSNTLRLTSTAVGAAARTGYKTLAGLTIGASYRVSVDVVGTGGTAGGAATSLLQALTTAGAAVQNSESAAGTGTRSLIFIATATSHRIQVRFDGSGGDATTYIDFDNLSVKAVSGNHGLQATASAQPKWQTGGLARFDGVDDCLVTPLQLGNAGSLVVKFNKAAGSDSQVIIGQRPNTTEDVFLLLNSAGRVSGSVGTGSTISDTANYAGLNTVGAITWNGTTVNLYVQGVLVATQAQSGSIVAGSATVILGSALTSSLFANVDLLHALGIKKALTAAEIAAITNKWGTT